MKYRHLAVILGAVITVSSVGSAHVMAESTEITSDAQGEAPEGGAQEMPEGGMPDGGVPEMPEGDMPGAQEEGERGTVKAIDGSNLTIALDGEEGSELTVTITDDTVITRRSSMMGGMPGGQGGPGEMGEAPEKPEGEPGEAPEKPEGEMGEAPEKPDGEMGGGPEGQGSAPGMPGGETVLTLDDISEGDTVTVTVDENGNALTVTLGETGGMPGGPGEMGGMPGQGGPGGMSQGVDSYSSANEYSSDLTVSGVTLSSTDVDENAALVDNGASVTFEGVTVSRESEESTGGDQSSFYGVGAAVLATDGNAYVTDSTITTDAAGGAGAFAYGDGTLYIADTDIKTEKGTSGGIHAAGGGTLYAWNVTAETEGGSSAAIRSDRGGGTMVVDGGSYISNGSGSPAIYSTADISVNDAELTATGSEAICIEGLNSIRLYDCDLTGNMPDDAQNDNTWTVILYQSMSGDSEVGNSTFQMDGGTLTSENGGLFYTTNTESTFILKDVDITAADDSEFFLQCTGNSNQRGWGSSGSNGADCSFTGISQDMNGDVIWDSISNLDLYLTEGSTLTGAVIDDETWAGNGGAGYCNVYISSDSTWTVTGDSLLSKLSCEGTITDENGNTVTIVGTDGTVYVQGESAYTITTAEYSETADLSGANTIDAWENHAVEKPEQI